MADKSTSTGFWERVLVSVQMKLSWDTSPGLNTAHPWREAALPVAPIYEMCRAPFLSSCLFSFVGGLVYLNGGIFLCQFDYFI